VNASQFSPQRLWRLAAGFGVWCSALAALYAFHGIGCASAWSPAPLRIGLCALLAAHLIMIGWLWRDFAATDPDPGFGQTDTFLHAVIIWTLMAALITTILTLGPPLLLTICL
jgi:hypothetical protein